ncbi:MAG: YceI family protein [Deltaproteobacteria bacterium]|nr:YceI family protein [Deltaproteobacteria bacterium]
MLERVRRLLIGLFVVFCWPANSFGDETFWNLPQDLSAKNTNITFEVDTTWHKVHGVAEAVNGKVWLEDLGNYSSVRGEVVIPVEKLDTDNGPRDKKMRNVMAASTYPQIKFSLSSVDGLCPLEVLENQKQCDLTLKGKLSIRDVEQEMLILGSLSKVNGKYRVSGKFGIDWSAFGVEDPSIIIARVKRDVEITFQLDL